MAHGSPQPRLILLTGAPDSQALEWTEDALTAPLLPIFDAPSCQIEGLESTTDFGANSRQPDANAISVSQGDFALKPLPPSWRWVPLERRFSPKYDTPLVPQLNSISTEPKAKKPITLEVDVDIPQSRNSLLSNELADTDVPTEIAAATSEREHILPISHESTNFVQSHHHLQSSQDLKDARPRCKFADEQVAAEIIAATHALINSSFLTHLSDDAHENLDTTGQFTEHSLRLHDELPSSQILFAPQSQAESNASNSFISFSTNTTDVSATIHQIRSIPHFPLPPLTELSELPSSATIDALQPQTLTVNLLAGIIFIPPSPRPVVPRRWRAAHVPPGSLDLLELIVGDPTRSGFAISLWLGRTPDTHMAVAQYPQPTVAEDAMRATALSLRRGDIVLFRNLALTSWNGTVTGQSLRRGRTTIDILHRAERYPGGVFSTADLALSVAVSGASPIAPEYSMIHTVRRLRDWLYAYVPLVPIDSTRNNGIDDTFDTHRATVFKTLPPDTPSPN